MSAFKLTDKSTAELADFTAAVLNHGFNYFGFSAPRNLANALKETKVSGLYRASAIYVELSEMNNAALATRYGKNEQEYYGNYENPVSIYKPRVNGSVQPWHYAIIKKLQCYLYQCSEGDIDSMPLYKSLEEFASKIAMYIVEHSAEYDAAKWE